MSSLKVKKGDNVKVIAGEDKGTTGKVLAVETEGNKVLVEGVNIVSRHTKPRSAQKTGGIIKSERGINASKVMIVCPACGNETRVGFAVDAEGKKYRFCKNSACKANIDKAAKEDKKAAKPVKKAAKAEAPAAEKPKAEKPKKEKKS